MKVMVDSPADGDGGFGQGGVFHFAPAGQDGDTHEVGELAARAIMEDPGMAQHFTCTPPLAKPAAAQVADEDAAPVADAKPDGAAAPRKRRARPKAGKAQNDQ